MREKKKVLCYSHRDFNALAELNGWNVSGVPSAEAVISICPKNSYDGYQRLIEESENVLNIDFDDCSPMDWWNGNDYYDDLLDDFLNETDKSRGKFSCEDSGGRKSEALDYAGAQRIVSFIDSVIGRVRTIYVHCSAGVSRSQGVVRYILDTYDYDFETRKENPCVSPNMHVTIMLKRIKRLIS